MRDVNLAISVWAAAANVWTLCHLNDNIEAESNPIEPEDSMCFVKKLMGWSMVIINMRPGA